MVDLEELKREESEAAVIATLINHPDYAFFSENLKSEHFFERENQLLYKAIKQLNEDGVSNIDSFNILEVLRSDPKTWQEAARISGKAIDDLVESSVDFSRNTVEEYQIVVNNVLDSAFRREAIVRLKECESLCADKSHDDIQQKIYSVIDDVMTKYSYAEKIPLFKDVVDQCWKEIESRQNDGYAGIPFKFRSLNDYATIESGELFIFAAEAKQGKSMMLLNCAMDLLKRDKAVLYIDSELNTRLFTARVIAHLTGIEYKRLTAGGYEKEDEKKIRDAIEWLKGRRFVHIYLPMFDKQTIFTTVKKIKHTMGLDVLIIDYFKSSGEGDAFNTYQELGAFVDMVKNKICGDMKICGIGAAQATITGKIADSAKIGRNASTIAMITDKTPEEIEMDGEECGNKKLRVVLNRNGMQMASGEYIDLKFDGNHVLYEEAKQHEQHDPF